MAGIDMVVSSLGVSFEVLMMLVFGIGGLIFYAKDVKLGIVLHILIYSSLFIWFYVKDLAWQKPLIMFFIFLVLLALSIYAVNKSQENPYGMV